MLETPEGASWWDALDVVEGSPWWWDALDVAAEGSPW
jgi:hypothetical protein